MVFSSMTFLWIFLPIVFVLSLVVRNIKVQNIILLIFSLLFYAWGEPAYLLILLASVIMNWGLGLLMESLPEHKKGVLSSVLNTISSDSGSVLTINQGIPLQGVANATVSIETVNLSVDLEALLDKLRMVDGVKRLEVLGQAQA